MNRDLLSRLRPWISLETYVPNHPIFSPHFSLTSAIGDICCFLEFRTCPTKYIIWRTNYVFLQLYTGH